MTTTTKIEALAEYLEIDIDEISESEDDNCIFEDTGGTKYLVCTDEEANDRDAEYIRENMWTFQPWHIADHITADIDIEDIERLQMLGEDANPIIAAMLDDVDKFIYDMIVYAGRGPFLDCYDDDEYEIGDYYLYMM